jgi:hypothetical protein
MNILQRSGGPRITALGCSFSVSSKSPDLRVFWSGTYYIFPSYFGHPTTPTVSVLQPGTYIFDPILRKSRENDITQNVFTQPGSTRKSLR